MGCPTMTRTRPRQDLIGRRVLVVEDQYLVADEICHTVADLGGTVIGPVATVSAALQRIAETTPDLAMLDVDLNGERVYPVADALLRAGVPFAFTSGFDAAMMEAPFRHAPYLEKPIRMAALARMLVRLSAEAV